MYAIGENHILDATLSADVGNSELCHGLVFFLIKNRGVFKLESTATTGSTNGSYQGSA